MQGRLFAGSRPRPRRSLATFLLVWLRANSTTAGMVFLVLVVWWATQAGIVLSIYTAVLCALCFDFFFLPPVHTFLIDGRAAMGRDGLVCAELPGCEPACGARAETDACSAQQREEDVGKLYSLSQEMMLFEDADRLIRDLPGAIGRIFALEGVVLYVCDHDRFYSSTGEVSPSVQAHMQAVAQGLNPTLSPFAGYQTNAVDAGNEARRRSGVAAGFAFARSRNCGVRPGIHRSGAFHRHGSYHAH